MTTTEDTWQRYSVPADDLIKSKDDDVGAFVTCLAIVFNDLRDLIGSEPAPAPVDAPLAEKVQVRGLHARMFRYMAGVIRELLVLIEENTTTIEGAAFQAVLERLPADAMTCWQDLVEAATDKKGTAASRLRIALVQIRCAVAFHYSPNAIASTWRQLVGRAQSDDREAPYFLGPTMEHTRFAFADTAASETMLTLPRLDETGFESVDKMIAGAAYKVNIALRLIVAAFAEDRGGTRHALPSP